MRLAITSIQRNRQPWIVEWLAFHLLVGFNRFFIYCHKCDDGMEATLLKLAQHCPITVYTIGDQERPQLAAYQHAWDHHQAEVDWMAFIDGDEFLFPARDISMAEALAAYRDVPLSALAVYWICYGSNGHIADPGGLVMEDYPRHSERGFGPNRHFKSIARGGQALRCIGSHLFSTPRGTYDEQLRQMLAPTLQDAAEEPSWEHLRINHYLTQHYDYFKQVKQNIGAADRASLTIRPDEWFSAHDRNECDDGIARRYLPALKRKVAELRAVLAEGQAITPD
jgi:hypothetical protein